MESIRITTTLPAAPEEVYRAWLSGEEHAKMTGSAATSDPKAGGRFAAWDGYITGVHGVLEPGRRIVQTWRTQEFPGSAPDSRLEIRFSKAPRGTRLVLLQSDIPDGQGEMYTEGWEQHYFEPMNHYFAARPRKPASKKKKTTQKKKSAKASKRKAPKSAKASKRKAPKAKRQAKKQAPKAKKSSRKKRG